MKHFDKYRHHPDPEKRERASNWRMAIGLQAVDGLKTSEYLIGIARQQIEGEITMNEVQVQISAYHQSKKKQKRDADKAIGTDEKL